MPAREIDITSKYQEANKFIWNALQEHVLSREAPPTLDEAGEYVRQGVKILLDALTDSDSRVEDHLLVRMQDLDGSRTKVGIVMEPKTEHGETVVQLFGLSPGDDDSEQSS